MPRWQWHTQQAKRKLSSFSFDFYLFGLEFTLGKGYCDSREYSLLIFITNKIILLFMKTIYGLNMHILVLYI